MRPIVGARRSTWSGLFLMGAVVLLLGSASTVALGDPGGQGKGKGHGSPTPSPAPTAAPSSSPSASPTVASSPTASEAPASPASSSGSSSSDTTHPPGNNGTVKIDGVPFDDAPNNEPHVGCTLQLDFYGYDEGDLTATYLLQLWAPTGSGEIASGSTAIGEDPAGGGRDLDASVTLNLAGTLASSGVAPHPQQGWHLRLTVHAQGSIGADVKHKMLWVTCAVPTQPTSPPTSPSVSPTHTRSSSPSTSPSVLGSTVHPPGGPLAFTGSSPATLLVLALILLLVGTAALRLSSRTTHEPDRQR